MKKYFLIPMLLGLLLFSMCKSKIIIEPKVEIEKNNEIPACIEEGINTESTWTDQVWQYQYNGQTVYFILQKCCDHYNYLLDENCNSLCAPSGSITGNGDGRCPDFFDKRTDGKLIWKYERSKE